MNPISSVPSGARAETRDPAAVPTDLMGLFAAMFAATAAQPVPPLPPVVMPAVPEGIATPEPAMGAEGEQPLTASGGWPGAGPNGTPAFPAFMATGRPRHEQPGLKAALVDLPSARPALPEAVPQVQPESVDEVAPEWSLDAITPEPARGGRMPLPEGMTLVQPKLAQAIERALASANGTQVLAASAQPVALEVRNGRSAEPVGRANESEESLSDLVAREGLRGANRGTPDAPAHGAAAAGRGKGKAATTEENGKGKGEAEAGTAGFVPTPLPEKGAPVAPPQASLAGVTPHAVRPETPAPAVGGVAGPVALPQEKPLPAVPTTATIAFDNGEGLEGRLRVSLRGDTLRATIQVPDAAAAARMEHDLGGLTRALRAQGFEEARLTVDVARSASADARHDEPSPREQKPSRDHQPHTNERHTRRERGAAREER